MYPDGILRIELWHPDSPGSRVIVRPCWLRRLGVIRSVFATTGEVLRMYKEDYGL